MKNNSLYYITIIVIVCIMLLCNKKVRVFPILLKQLYVFKNAKTNKISLWDIMCFLFFPIILGALLGLKFNLVIDSEFAGILTTIFALVFTVLFGFAAILIGKIDSKNKIERQVVGETFISIMACNIMSLLTTILATLIIKINNQNIIKLLSIVIYSISFMIIMLILMITKRIFVIYCDNINESEEESGKGKNGVNAQ